MAIRLKDIKVGQTFHVRGFQTRYMRIVEEASDGTLMVLDPRKPTYKTIPVVCLEDGSHKGEIRSFPADHLIVSSD